MEATVAVPLTTRKITHVGIAGLAVALLSLAAAVLSPWAIDALTPEKKPIDEVAVDAAVRIKDRLAAKATGQSYVAPAEPPRTDWSKWYAGSVVGAGVLAICVGVVGLVARHDGRLNSASVAVGASAIVFQFALMIAAVLLFILLIGLVLSALDISV